MKKVIITIFICFMVFVVSIPAIIVPKATSLDNPYTVLDSCDTTDTVSGNFTSLSVDSSAQYEGLGCISAFGKGKVKLVFDLYNTISKCRRSVYNFIEFRIFAKAGDNATDYSVKLRNSEEKVILSENISEKITAGSWNKIYLDISEIKDNIAFINILLSDENNKKLSVMVDDISISQSLNANYTAYLSEMIKNAGTYFSDKNTYTSGSQTLLRQAVTEGKAALKYTQRDVDIASTRLFEAINGLEIVYNSHISDLITTHGRTYFNDDGTLSFNWTGSGFTFRFFGTGADADILFNTICSAEYDIYLSIYVDGNENPDVFSSDVGMKSVTLAHGLTPGIHTITVRKRSEIYNGGEAVLSDLSVTDGYFLSPEKNSERRIEFIGDSITCGHGNLSLDPEGEFDTSTEDGCETFATMASNAFGAEYSIISRSGIGFCYSRCEIPLTMSEIYGYTDYFSQYYGNEGIRSKKDCSWSFENSPQDLIVINLGTNDVMGDYSKKEYFNNALNFLKQIRSYNPDSYIIWAYGIMKDKKSDLIKKAVNALKNSGDTKVSFLKFNKNKKDTGGYGLGTHPSMAAHISASQELITFISAVTGWDTGEYSENNYFDNFRSSDIAVKDDEITLITENISGGFVQGWNLGESENNYLIAQKFISQFSSVSSADLNLFIVGSAQIDIKICTSYGSTPIASASKLISEKYYCARKYRFHFDPVSITAGQKYYLIITAKKVTGKAVIMAAPPADSCQNAIFTNAKKNSDVLFEKSDLCIGFAVNPAEFIFLKNKTED